MVSRASPVRTCVGCRRRAPASELLRIVAERITIGNAAEPPSRESGAAVSVVPDLRRRRPGRGAYLHPDPACLALAERRRAFGRALRISGVADTGPLTEYLSAESVGNLDRNGGTRVAADPARRSEQPMVGHPTRDTQGRTINMSTR